MKKRPVKSTNRLVTPKKRRRTIDPATRQLIWQIASGVGVFALVSLIITGVWFGTRLDALTIKTVTVAGGQTISHSQVQTAVEEAMSGTYFGLVPKQFAWFYPHDAIASSVLAISRVKNPVIERVSGNEISILVDEYIPYGLWCTSEGETNCLFVDKDGIAFAPAPVLTGGSLYRFYTLGQEPQKQTVLRDTKTLAQIISLADALVETFALPVTHIELDTVGDVFFRVVGGGEIKVTLNQTVTETIENLALVLSADDFKDIAPGTFQYIDLRFGNKVFVNDTVPAVATSTIAEAIAVRKRNVTPDGLATVVREVAEEVGVVVEEPSVLADYVPERAEDSIIASSTDTNSLAPATTTMME